MIGDIFIESFIGFDYPLSQVLATWSLPATSVFSSVQWGKYTLFRTLRAIVLVILWVQ